MLLSWMAYSTLVGALAYAVAVALDRLAATVNTGRRWVWASAIVVVMVAPVILATREPPAATPVVVSQSINGVAAVSASTPATSVAPARASLPSALTADVLARDAWLAMSLIYFVWIARGAISVYRRSARWPSVERDGLRVLIAPDVGPAVVGMIRPRIVLPQWTLSLDPIAQRLVLRHEAEHLRAHDPQLLLAATFAAGVFPWNPLLWALRARLRLAIEIDCDRRVLCDDDQALEYGRLLLAVSARRTVRLPLAASLAERRPLERRIKAMTALPPRHPRLLSAACIAIALMVTTAAVRAPHPAPFARAAAAPMPASTATPTTQATATTPPPRLGPAKTRPLRVVRPSAPPMLVRPIADSLTVAEIRALIASHQPAALTGDSNSTRITIVVDANNRYVTSLAEGGRPASSGIARGVMTPTGGGRGARGGGGAPAPETYRLRAVPPGDSSGVAHVEVVNRVGQAVPRMSTDYTAGATGLRGMQLFMHGFNTDALGMLIDLSAVQTVRQRTYMPGEIGSGVLYVYVVRLRP
jgi:beta-lactamase regulating signal transducer with metallopeptidase domain